MEKFLTILGEAKYVITTIILIVTSFVGGIKLMSDYFVTKSYADTQINDIKSQLIGAMNLSKTNTILIYQLRLSKFEDKMESGKKLSPSEQRQYDILKKQLEKLAIRD